MKLKKFVGVGFLIVLTLLVFVGCNDDKGASPEPNDVEVVDSAGLALIEQKCVSCHLLEQSLKVRAEGQWPDVVERMIGYKPDLLSEQEQIQITEYLQTNHSN